MEYCILLSLVKLLYFNLIIFGLQIDIRNIDLRTQPKFYAYCVLMTLFYALCKMTDDFNINSNNLIKMRISNSIQPFVTAKFLFIYLLWKETNLLNWVSFYIYTVSIDFQSYISMFVKFCFMCLSFFASLNL